MTEHDKYYAAAQGWAEGQVEAERRARRLGWIVAAVAGAIAFILAVALALLIPLKSVQPFVVTVDRQSGAVEAPTTVAGGRLTQNEAVIQAQLANYVRVRETFDASDLAENYRRVQLLSSGDVRAAYIAQMAAGNPASPLRALSPGDTLKVRIKSVSLTASGSALVRYDIDRTAAGGRSVGSTAYVSAISYGFSNVPLRAADRFETPLGFQVTRYRRDAEGMVQ
jgi:type IV secretion system protein VirB8